MMKKGLYRFTIPGTGECARTHASAGDGAPFLERALYEALHFQPPFESLPQKAEYLNLDNSARYPIRTCDRLWQD